MPFSLLQRAAGILCLALSITSCFSSPIAESVVLKPFHVANYEASFGLQPRDPAQLSILDLQSQGQLMYAGSPENGSLLFANMTLYAPNGLLMVFLEHFDHLTSAIDCQGDDGMMSLTFDSPRAFDYALQAWGFVNANANGKFMVIANHKGCGPDEERQAYIINSIREDSEYLTTYLAAEPAPWTEIGGSFDLDFGHFTTSHPLKAPKWWRWLHGDIDETKETDFDVNLGHRDKVENIWHDDRRLMLDCINCFVAGSFHIKGHIQTLDWEIQEATLSASPKGFNATMELQAKVTRTDKLDTFSDKKELASMAVPELGIDIPKILKFGVTLAYQIGYSTKLMGSATVILGATSSLPDGAIITIDLKDPEKSSWSGFEDAALVPIFDFTDLSASVQFAVFTQADMSFGIEIPEHAKADVELNLKLPQLSATYAAGYKEKGFCSQDDDASKTGVKSTIAIAIELWFEVKAALGKKKKDIYSYKLFNLTNTLDEGCKPLAIEGLLENPTNSLSGVLPVPTELIPS